MYATIRSILVSALAAALIAACANERQAADPPATSPAATAAQAPMPQAPAPPAQAESADAATDSGLAAHTGLRYDCAADADCAIKDIGNCCGHYPACVNVDSPTDPEGVTRECAQKGLAGICGYPVIEACVCRNARCEPAPGERAGVPQ